jgi:hypothetical protein
MQQAARGFKPAPRGRRGREGPARLGISRPIGYYVGVVTQLKGSVAHLNQ